MKSNLSKKLLSFILAINFIFGAFPFYAFAEDLQLYEEEKGYLADLYVTEANNENIYAISPEFSSDVKEYVVVIPEAKSDFYVYATLSEDAPEDATITAKYNRVDNSRENSVEIASGSEKGTKLIQVVNTSGKSVPVSIEVGVDGDIQTYSIIVKRSEPCINSLSVKDTEGNTIPLNKKFDRKVKDGYSVNVSLDNVVISAKPRNSQSKIIYNGSENEEVEVFAGETTIIMTVTNTDGYSSEYVLTVYKKNTSTITFDVVPSTATIFLTDKFNERVWPEEENTFSLLNGEKYTYVITQNGYKTKSGVINTEENEVFEVELEKAPVNSFKQLSANWPSFGFSPENNIVIDYPTPLKLEESALYWATKVGEGFGSGATGVPILVDDYLYTYAGTRIVKVDKMTGEIVATGIMDRNSSFAINSPTYANGMLFVGLSNGGIQAFNAETLESLWLYEDVLGGQPNAQIAYNDGYIYSGFWNEENSEANFACISVTDEDPDDPKEKKLASWTHTQVGGFYWAGAYIRGDYVYVGTDDGESGYTTGHAHLISFNKKTGEIIENIEMKEVGDIRSSITYSDGKLYFTSKGGYFYEAEFNEKTGDIISIRSLKLDNGLNDSDNPPMSTSTPTVYNGRAYIGVSGIGQFAAYSGHNITVIDIDNWNIAYKVTTQGYPQTTGTLTTHYEESTGAVYVYFFDNYTPGKLRILIDKPGQTAPHETITEKAANGKEYQVAPYIFAPTGSLAQYCICTPIIDADGTLYFKNDSAYIMAVGSAVERIEVTKMPDKTEYQLGEYFDPTGMEVTAYYINGTKRDVTKYVSYSEEPLAKKDANFQIRYEQVGSDEIPHDIIELDIISHVVDVVEVKKSTAKSRITLRDTIKLDDSVDETALFVDKAAGGTFYVGVLSEVELENVNIETTGMLKGEILDFTVEKYRSTGEETYSVYNKANPDEEIKGGKNLKSSDMALKIAERLNNETETTLYEVKCDQFFYVAKIVVPKNYEVSHKIGTYKIKATMDGKECESKERVLVSDVSIFEYEYLKYSARNGKALIAMSEAARGYSDYLKDIYGYSYKPAYENQAPTVVCTTGFRAIQGEDLMIECGNNVLLEIFDIAKNQRGVNFIFNNPNGTIDDGEEEKDEEKEDEEKEEKEEEKKKIKNYSLTYYGKQPIMSNYKITWDLGCNYFDLRENLKVKVEEEDVITFYITKDGKYFDEFTFDYMTGNIYDKVVVTINGEAGTSLGAYKITTIKPAGSVSEETENEVNPNTGAY